MDASRRAQEAEREARARVFKALADARRLEILEVLATSGPLSGTELAERVNISVALLSHHCKILADAGFLDRRQQGQSKYCTLDFVRLREATECWLSPLPLGNGVHAPPVLSAHAVCRDEAAAAPAKTPRKPASKAAKTTGKPATRARASRSRAERA